MIELTFSYRFPKAEDPRRVDWINSILKYNNQTFHSIKPSYRVCENHFEKKFILRSFGNVRLDVKAKACPTIFSTSRDVLSPIPIFSMSNNNLDLM